ncbi:MAG: prepilin-type N-terminal cleavage/methylation domain-containing protein [Burkholderiales bacterium]|nr:prepilin-type N-terminal cleavage/methylation domain-containing protein [Burkholderiales bacterium]
MRTRHAAPRHTQFGFTLIELLVAISVMALLSLMSWQALDGMGRTEALTRQRTDDVLAIQAGLGQWGADLDALVETGEVPAIDFDGRTLRLTRRDALESAYGSPGLQVVAWGLQDGSWTRWQSSGLRTRGNLAQAWEAAARWGQRPAPADASRQVAVAPASDWQVFYFRNDAWTHPLSSAGTSAAPPTGDGKPAQANLPTLPDGVRLVLTLSPGQALSGELVRDWARPVLGGGKS